jgi:hypothetical protein
LLWIQLFGSWHEDQGDAVKEVSDGYVIAGLYTTYACLIKRDFNGEPVWERRLDLPGDHFSHAFDLEVVDDGFVICGARRPTPVSLGDVYVVKTDRTGNVLWRKTIGGHECDVGYSIEPVGENSFIVAGETKSFGSGLSDGYLIKLGPEIYDTDDPLALAYNGNRHLVRKPNTEELYLVYTRMDSVIYQYSSNGGTNWTTPFAIGRGKFPALTLSSAHLPSVCWTDEIGGLWYRRQVAPGQWSVVYRLYYPVGPLDPFVNSPPSIAIVPGVPDRVHILITRTSRIQLNGVVHTVEDYSFPITNPVSGTWELIESGVGGLYPLIRLSPSLARSSVDNSLHAVWMRQDTVCYATKQIGQPWNNWGPQFRQNGIWSAHPFVECYGDMVYVVWEHTPPPGAPEDVWKASNRVYVLPPKFFWENLSRTPNTPSRFPVNALGTFTVFQDSPYPPINGPEIYYKIHPEDPLINISQTLGSSRYPQTVARFTGANTYLYTAWLEGDGPAYGIRFKKVQHIPMEFAYLSSHSGSETPSPYLVARDSFISTWRIPVDVGHQKITYRFPLEPNYRYKIKVVAYHETSGQWREWVKIDNKMKHLTVG